MIKFLGLDALTHLCAKLKEYVDSKSSSGDSLPVGAGCDYFGTTPPEGFLFADGSAVSRTTYADLFAVIGTTYGAGDGSTTFNLPDKRSRVSVMMNSSDSNFNTLGKKVGSASTTLVAANLPAQSGTLSFHGLAEGSVIHTVSGVFSTSTKKSGSYRSAGSVTGGADSYPVIKYSNSGSSKAFSNIQQTLVCNYIIKALNITTNVVDYISDALEGKY